MVYKRASKSSQLKFHKFLKKRQDTRLAHRCIQLDEKEAIVVALKQEAADLTMEIEEQEEKLEKQAWGYVRLMRENDELRDEKEVLIKQCSNDQKWAIDTVNFERDWKFNIHNKYDKLLDKQMETEIKLVEVKESLKELDVKYTDLLTKHFEE